MSFMTGELSNQIPAVLAMLSIFSVVGTFGNLLVIIVYALKQDRLTASLFILVLASSDILCCLTLIPTTMFVEYVEWKMRSNVLCKSYYFLNNSFIPFSSLLISCIAFDRYFCLCHPFLHILTLSRAKKLIGILVLVALTIGFSATFTVRVEQASVKNPNDFNFHDVVYNQSFVQVQETQQQLDIFECTEIIKINTTMLDRVVYQIVQKSQIVSYVLCIISVVVLYVLIYQSVSKVFKKRRQLKGSGLKRLMLGHSEPTVTTVEREVVCDQLMSIEANVSSSACHSNRASVMAGSTTLIPTNGCPQNIPGRKAGDRVIPVIQLIPSTPVDSSPVRAERVDLDINQNNSKDACGLDDVCMDRENTAPIHNHAVPLDLSTGEVIERKPKKSIKHLRDTATFQNLKTAGMLFVVAIVYIVTFLPAMLMASGILTLYLPIFYLYYVNNAINPIVYGFMNPNFRQDIRRLFCRG